MGYKRESSPALRMKRIALVICEGETEANYINLLKLWYKSPIRVISHIEGTKITQNLVERRVNELRIGPLDKVDVFLMYDMDVETITEKLMDCKAGKLLSNPCFEIWLLLHVKDQKSAIKTEAVIKELKKEAHVWNAYSKAGFTDTQKKYLKDHISKAIERAKALKEFQNPSSTIYKLVEMIQNENRRL